MTPDLTYTTGREDGSSARIIKRDEETYNI